MSAFSEHPCDPRNLWFLSTISYLSAVPSREAGSTVDPKCFRITLLRVQALPPARVPAYADAKRPGLSPDLAVSETNRVDWGEQAGRRPGVPTAL